MTTRRKFLGSLAAGGAMLATPASRALAQQAPDLVLKLTAAPAALPIFPGTPTRVLRLAGEVLAGRPDALQASGSYLGPTIELRRGERVRIHFDNRLSESSIIHWHGLIVPESADGHPRFAVNPGERYTYEFTVRNPPGTYLYHPHPHGRTGFQVYHGLAGMIIIRDAEEDAIGLPRGPYELPLVLQDREIDGDNQLIFRDTMMTRMAGVLGDTAFVNGRPDVRFDVSRRHYRLRVLNASNARIYKLAWSDGRPMTVIGTDNGLIDGADGPQQRPYVMLGPTERVEILEDFSTRQPRAEVALISEPFDTGEGMEMMMGGGMGGMMGGNSNQGRSPGRMGMMESSQGREMLLARFTVGAEHPQPLAEFTLPKARSVPPEPRFELTTRIGFRHMRGFLNGRDFEMKAVAPDERVPRNVPLLWTFEHEDGMGMHMPHPMHVHGVRFRVVERQRGPHAPTDVADGFVDQGHKDTVLVFPGERVRVAMTASEPGLFMYHCHNLEHEDGGMMRNFFVEA